MKIKLLIVAIPFVLLSCSKGETAATTPTTSTPTAAAEADIAFKIEIDAKEVDYNTVLAALSATQKININITSVLPKNGVTIEVSTIKNKDNSVVSSSTSFFICGNQ